MAADERVGAAPSLIREPAGADIFGSRYGRGDDGRPPRLSLCGPMARVDAAVTRALTMSRDVLAESGQALTSSAVAYWAANGRGAQQLAAINGGTNGSPT